eukprot:TRINITY_DN4740_c0_g1_i1.p1 TRINITY_DN4740_c0_g1~~TRINITY_DN4740_c0_g1_i1.p1  ORF type:complete len:383 (+),score=138.99 TRINITY_DN4740_c0_g1_i1:51-1199(+)
MKTTLLIVVVIGIGMVCAKDGMKPVPVSAEMEKAIVEKVEGLKGMEVNEGSGSVLKIVIGYCPTDFKSAGAIVKVDVHTGNWTVESKFDWPSEIFGCLANYDPTYYFDVKKNLLWFDFLDDTGFFAAVDLSSEGKGVVKTVTAKDIFFTGFENFVEIGDALVGLSGTATQNGPCNNGCFEFGSVSMLTKDYKRKALVLFKAVMDDSAYVDAKGNYFVQASYDLREKTCGPSAASLCLLQLDVSSGALVSAKYTPNWTAYKYGKQNQNGKVLTWVNGFDKECQHPYNDFAFASVDLNTANATLISCIPKDVTVQEDEWESSFSHDDSMMATASGNAEKPHPQVLVFDTSSAKAILNAELTGLNKALGAAEGLLWVWGVEFTTD